MGVRDVVYFWAAVIFAICLGWVYLLVAFISVCVAFELVFSYLVVCVVVVYVGCVGCLVTLIVLVRNCIAPV